MDPGLLADGPALWRHSAALVDQFGELLAPTMLVWWSADVDRDVVTKAVRPRRLARRLDLRGLRLASAARRDFAPIGTVTTVESISDGRTTLLLDASFNWAEHGVTADWTAAGGRIISLNLRPTRPVPTVRLRWLESGRTVVETEVGLGAPPAELHEAAQGIPWRADQPGSEPWNTRRATAIALASRLTGTVIDAARFTAPLRVVRLVRPPTDTRPIAAVPGHPATADPVVAEIAADTTFAEPTVRRATALLASIGAQEAGLDEHPVVRSAVARLHEMGATGHRPDDDHWRDRLRAAFTDDLRAYHDDRAGARPRPDDWDAVSARVRVVTGLSNAFDANAYHGLVGGWWTFAPTRVIDSESVNVTANEAIHTILGVWMYRVRDSGRYPV